MNIILLLCWFGILLFYGKVAFCESLTKDQLCVIDIDENLTSVCRNCTNISSNAFPLQSFQEQDISHLVLGCFVRGVINVADQKNVYEEIHVINIDREVGDAVFLSIDDVWSDSFPISMQTSGYAKFTIVLLATKPLEWIVSYGNNNNSKYLFFVSRDSTVISRSSGKTVSAQNVGFSLFTRSSSRYSSAQVKRKVCTETLRRSSCQLTSYLQLKTVDFLGLTVGKSVIQNDGDAATVCNVHSLQLLQNETRITASSLQPVNPLQSCANALIKSPYLFVIDVEKHSSYDTALLVLHDVFTLPSDQEVYIVLHSITSLKWITISNIGKDITTNINIMAFNGSFVDVDGLTISDDTGSVSVKYLSSILPEGKSLLELVRDIYTMPVTYYAKFANQTTLVRILFGAEQPTISSPPFELDQSLLRILHTRMSLSAWGSRLHIPKEILQQFGLRTSDIVVGNGSCLAHVEKSALWFDDLSACGMKRISIDRFNINIYIKNQSATLWFLYPKTKPSIKLLQPFSKTKSSQLTDVITKNFSFLAQVTATSLDRMGVNTRLEKCFLVAQNSSDKVMLVENNCPVDQYTNLVIPHSLSYGEQYKTFMFSLTDEHSLATNQLYNLTCVLSRCFASSTKVPVTSTLLPQCFNAFQCQSRKNANVERQIFTETVSINAFKYTPHINCLVEPSTAKPDSASAIIVLLTAIVVFFIGVMLGGLITYIFFRIWIRKRGRLFGKPVALNCSAKHVIGTRTDDHFCLDLKKRGYITTDTPIRNSKDGNYIELPESNSSPSNGSATNISNSGSSKTPQPANDMTATETFNLLRSNSIA